MVSYSGSDNYDAHKWLADFECACDSVDGDNAFCLKCIRRLMKPDSDAECLRIDNSVTYQQFRANFLQNFGHVYSVSDIINKLRKTTFNSAKTSVMGYILRMQEIAARVNIDEKQTIEFIIDGFCDRSANIAVLYSVQLKQLSHRYVQLRELSSVPLISFVRNTSDQCGKPLQAKSSGTFGSNIILRCFNCSGIGHLSKSCPEP